MLVTHIWMLWYIPYFYCTLVIYAMTYVYVHHKMHIQVGFGKRWFRHHWDHHCLGRQQYAYGVVTPLWDYIFGTRHEKK